MNYLWIYELFIFHRQDDEIQNQARYINELKEQMSEQDEVIDWFHTFLDYLFNNVCNKSFIDNISAKVCERDGMCC